MAEPDVVDNPCRTPLRSTTDIAVRSAWSRSNRPLTVPLLPRGRVLTLNDERCRGQRHCGSAAASASKHCRKVAEARRRGAEQREPDRARTALASPPKSGRTWNCSRTATRWESVSLVRRASIRRSLALRRALMRQAARTPEMRSERSSRRCGLILLVGGDVTAVDVATTIDDLDAAIPILGVPAGVRCTPPCSACHHVRPRRIAGPLLRDGARVGHDIDQRLRGGKWSPSTPSEVQSDQLAVAHQRAAPAANPSPRASPMPLTRM
ncbi:hypothetical protein C8039_04270 [Halogeometricum sp. wsp3]|nr:hypothetical protein C8039_04270 [Halogeometricum sp. wsp3]